MCEIILHFILLEDILMTSDCRYVVMIHKATPILLNQCLYPTSRIGNMIKISENRLSFIPNIISIVFVPGGYI